MGESWGGKGLFGLHVWVTVHRRGKNSRRDHRGTLFTGLLFIAYSACFLTQPRTLCPALAPYTVSRALPHQELIKKTSHRLAYRQVLSQVRLPLPTCPSLCQVGENKQAPSSQPSEPVIENVANQLPSSAQRKDERVGRQERWLSG